MGRFVKGDVVVVPFPFSDLTTAKRRPALVLADLAYEDIVLCQITSQDTRDIYAMELLESDFDSGSLKKASNIRPNRLFTADRHIVLYKTGHLKNEKINSVINALIDIFRM